MLQALNSAVSGMQQFQQEMNVIGNNVANVDTTAFKTSRTDFADTFSNTLKSAGNGSSAMQIGTGVTTSATEVNFGQGSLSLTGVQTDLAVSGGGFFIVKAPISNQVYATRAGDFTLDANGYLVTSSGYRVQGYSDSGLSTLGDVKIDGTQRPSTSDASATMTAYSIGQDGKIEVSLSDGTQYTRGQVLLQGFLNEQSLVKEGGNLYSGLTAAGPIATNPSAPGTSGLGNIESGELEQSNVDLSAEFSNLITTQRAFEANSRIITTSDEMLQDLVNLKR
jgi:flagellar hook protein FlgE